MKRIFAVMLALVMVVGLASTAMAQCNGCGKGKGKGPKGPNGPKGPGDGTCLNVAFGQGEVFLAGGGKNQEQWGKGDGEEDRPGNGDQIKDRDRLEDPAGPGCPGDCPGCPDCDGPNGPNGPGDGTCRKAAFGQGEVFLAGGGQNQEQWGKDTDPGNGEQNKDRVCPEEPAGPGCPDDCPGCPDCDGPNGPGDGDGICDNE